MIANLDMVYLEKPYGLIKARIPNIKLNLQRTGKYDTYCAVLISHSSSCEKDRDHETL